MLLVQEATLRMSGVLLTVAFSDTLTIADERLLVTAVEPAHVSRWLMQPAAKWRGGGQIHLGST